MAPVEHPQEKSQPTLGYRFAAMMAVAAAMATSLILGRLAGETLVADWQHAGSAWLFWMGLQSGCIILELIRQCLIEIAPFRRIGLTRRLRKLRVRARRRWMGGQSKADRRRVETGLIWPALFVIVVVLLLVPSDLSILALETAVMFYLAWLVFPYYRNAPDHPKSSIVSGAFFGFTMGYFAF
jgi:hypothetical protein